MPKWLEYNPSDRELYGVANSADIGHEFVMSITDRSADNNIVSVDIITITVISDKTTASDTSALQVSQMNKNSSEIVPIICPFGSSVTTVTIVLSSDINEMSLKYKYDLFTKLSHYLDIPKSIIKVIPLTHTAAMMDSSALVAGPGNVLSSPEPGVSVMIQWDVGCGNVFSQHMPILQKVEQKSVDGTLSKAIGHDIIGWHVSNKKPQIERVRRAVRATPTMVPDFGPPTQQAVPTVIIDPYSRVVPSMASPLFPEELHPVRPSQHRTKTAGRHMHHHTRLPKQSPKYHKTMFPYTAMPTATILSIMPTQTIEVAPTLTDTDLWPEPTMPAYSMPVSRTEDLIQPSMTIPCKQMFLNGLYSLTLRIWEIVMTMTILSHFLTSVLINCIKRICIFREP